MGAHTEGKVIAGLAGVSGKEAGTFEAHHCIRTSGTTHVVALTGRLHTGNETADKASKADAERLAACWNAFEGIATEDIARCHVVGRPIEAGLWSQSEDLGKRWGILSSARSWPSDSKNEPGEYKSAYKDLHGAWIGYLVEQIREAVNTRINKAKAEYTNTPSSLLPKVGDKWPGTEAIYAGKSLSRDGTKIVDLIFWLDESKEVRSYEDNIKYCESVSKETNSHAATRQQAIVINDNLRHLLSKDHWYWTETKSNSGEYAFVQYFRYGNQNFISLDFDYRALAVSEIH